MFLRSLLVLVVCARLLAAACEASTSETPPVSPEFDLLFNEYDPSTARWVSEGTLASNDMSAIPLDSSCRSRLLALFRNPPVTERSLIGLHPEPSAEVPGASGVIEILDRGEMVLLGRVIGRTSGFDCARRTVSTRLEISVDQVLKGTAVLPRKLYFIESGGILRHGSQTHDWGQSRIFPAISVGDQVLVSGKLSVAAGSEALGVIDNLQRFRVIDGLVENSRQASLKQSTRATLDSVRDYTAWRAEGSRR
jgi:hypothetical protein